ncbi:hypothetical protein [Polyangium sp. 15x6]|uniref:hypothetical protein n=1 Tax=Polyangium sp. 15x6 TaxID=3042687 RepID=UPI00249A4ECE|nr:hypothetical protein [Polyangium sp. 15x6]MDI3287801.1 hypothetical protein [Polyangium sp. 15x6]
MAHAYSLHFRNLINLGLVGMALYGMGCALEDAAVDPNLFDDPTLHGAGGEPNTGNTLLPGCLNDHGVQQTVRTLGAARLSSYLLDTLPSMPYMPAGDAAGTLAGCRREFLKVLVGCALPTGASVVDSNDPIVIGTGTVTRKYWGQIGLAPDWETRALTTEEKEFVTACVMARTNRFGEEIDILLDGDHPEIEPDSALQLTYPYVESTVWGNMFDSTVPLNPTHDPNHPTLQPFNAHVCKNYSDSTCPDAAFRVCDESDDCGFINHGPCSLMNCIPILGGSVSASCTAWPNRITIYLTDHATVCPIPIDPPIDP